MVSNKYTGQVYFIHQQRKAKHIIISSNNARMQMNLNILMNFSKERTEQVDHERLKLTNSINTRLSIKDSNPCYS